MIGIAITTTPERKDALKKTLEELHRYYPNGAHLAVVHDDTHMGVAYSKNKCLAYLYDIGCEHIFLFDDDTYPIAEGWWKPYVYSKEPHLMYCFKLPSESSSRMKQLGTDGKTVEWSKTRGCMLYIERKVLDIVGGMDTNYGQAFYEHTDWTNRIYNAGLTSKRVMDVVDSDKLLYCLDQDNKIASSIPDSVKRKNMRNNRELYLRSKTSKEFIPFR